MKAIDRMMNEWERVRAGYYFTLQRLLIISLLAHCGIVLASESYSSYTTQSHPTNVYFGDTHLHTNLSVDANGMRNENLTPGDAYRFAKGEAVTTASGMVAKLRRPLDFLVVADHAENMGVMRAARAAEPDFLALAVGREWYDIAKNDDTGTAWAINKPVTNEKFRLSIWQEVTGAADAHNKPGHFTAFIGYEWSSYWRPDLMAAIHRVVIFKDSSDKTNKIIPFSRYDSSDPEKLWAFMEEYEKNTGGDVLSIPHNSNLSLGQMYTLRDYTGKPFTADYAKFRSRWEPLVETTQFKGDSESHPLLSPTDEFADYETWNSWNGKELGQALSEKRKTELPHDYVRSALRLGLQEQARLGVNPFKVGMIGSTDAHTSLATADENNFWGKMTWYSPSAERFYSPVLPWAPDRHGWQYASSGYTAVWAEENTRKALFAAMKRKEVYATTGPRMVVRFFGGWAYKKDDAFRSDFAKIGYRNGVPMGGDLTSAPKGKSPTFLLRVTKDPDSANLDRVQIIKGWLDKQGKTHEKIFNVALSDGRRNDKNGKAPPVGNTVDIRDASYTNTIGDPELAMVWQDPDFNSSELAFYYLRVLEIPTPRWTAYDAKFFNVRDIPDEVPMITQERAYSSPIWYTP